MPKNIFTIDYEDWMTTSHYKAVVKDTNKKYLLEKPTHQLLDLLERHQVKATFFVLGQVAKDCSLLIRAINNKGHEIANHGYSHTPIHFLSPNDFIHELRETNKILEDIIQKKVKGFRAPFFSLNQKSPWVIDTLIEEGFVYDSSIFPMKTPRYGVNKAPLKPYYISSENILRHSQQQELIEFPISIYKSNFLKIPSAGGIYGRFLPEKIFLQLLKEIHKQNLIHLYIHPWELINKRELAPHPGWIKNILANYNSEQYINKLEKAIQLFQFTNIETWIAENKSYFNQY